MIVLGDNILVIKQKSEYSGLIQGVDSDENIFAKVSKIGLDVKSTQFRLGQLLLIDWHKAKKVKGDLFVVHEEDIIGILEDVDLK